MKKLTKIRRSYRRQEHIAVLNSDLNKLKDVTGSDRITALVLKVSPQDISDVRKQRAPLPPMAQLRLAKALKYPLYQALCLALSATARSNQSREFWLDAACGRWP